MCAGGCCQLSERPLLCSASHAGLAEVVIGGSDHALYIVDVSSAKLKRTLFGRTAGHTEWVTCAVYTPEGHVISGGATCRACGVHADAVAWLRAATGHAWHACCHMEPPPLTRACTRVRICTGHMLRRPQTQA